MCSGQLLLQHDVLLRASIDPAWPAGPDVTKRFLQQNNLELVVRSHEVSCNNITIDLLTHYNVSWALSGSLH